MAMSPVDITPYQQRKFPAALLLMLLYLIFFVLQYKKDTV